MTRTFLVSGMMPAYGKQVNDFISLLDLGTTGCFVRCSKLVDATIGDGVTEDQLARQMPSIKQAFEQVGWHSVEVSECPKS